MEKKSGSSLSVEGQECKKLFSTICCNVWTINTTMTAVQLVNSCVVIRVDYCNSLLAGLPVHQRDRIQSVLNYAARLVYGHRKYDHVTPLLQDNLHWLRVPKRVKFKCCLLVFKALDGLAPTYIADFVSKFQHQNVVPPCVRLEHSNTI